MPLLDDYYNNLPRAQSASDVASSISSTATSRTTIKEPFLRLSPELIIDIINYLPVAFISPFRRSIRAAERVILTNSFWRRRILHDMPWLWEINCYMTDTNKSEVDWRQVYQDLHTWSQCKIPRKIGGLVNLEYLQPVCRGVYKTVGIRETYAASTITE